MNKRFIASFIFFLSISNNGFSQVLKLEDALKTAVTNYDRLKSKQNIVLGAEQNTAYQRQNYLPDVTVAAQQSFGTINAQNGPMYAYGGLGAASTSMPLSEQNWNAAFGSLYLTNVNWNVFTFGRLKKQVNVALLKEKTAASDLEQETFQHEVKVAAAYLNLLWSKRMKFVQEKNYERAKVFFDITDVRAKSGLIPEVDAALAKAEVSNARSAEIKAHDKELDFSKTLSVLMGEDFKLYELDSTFNTRVPQLRINEQSSNNTLHPLLVWNKAKIDQSKESEQLAQAHRLPTISAFGVLQGRGSGFDWNYVQDNSAYSSAYHKGVGINRGNYLLGFSVSWNITNLFRQENKIKEQHYITASLENEYQRVQKELNAQGAFATAQLNNATLNFEETKTQLSAAQLAYKQHTALYENGLNNLVDYTQSLYSLNRAEIEFEIAQNNIWQALLMQAAAQGDLAILLNAIPTKP